MNGNSFTFHRSRKVYIRIIFLFVFLIGIFVLCGYLFYDAYINNTPVSNQFLKKWIVMLIFICILFFIFTGFLIKSIQEFLTATRPITLTNEGIEIGDAIFTFSAIGQIKTIVLGNISYESFYGASIILLNGEEKFILGEGFYKNDAILFKELENINQHRFATDEGTLSQINESQNSTSTTATLLPFEKKDIERETNDAQHQNTKIQEEEYFDVNIFTSITYLLSLIIVIISLSGIYKYIASPEISLFFLGMLVCIYYVAARESFHFIITNHTIQIKNKLLFGYSKTFILNDIRGIATYHKNSGRTNQYRTRIIFKDYKSISFSSIEFRKKQWLKFGQALRSAGVAVISNWET